MKSKFPLKPSQAAAYTLALIGFACLVRGAWMLSHPAGYLVAGVLLLVAGFFGGLDPRGPSADERF